MNSSGFTKKNTDSAKGVAILFMLFYHLFTNEAYVGTPAKIPAAPFDTVFFMIARFGNICVSVFVFLTAFGISKGIFEEAGLTLKDAYNKAAGRFGKLMLNFFIFYVSVQAVWFWCFDYSSLYDRSLRGVVSVLLDATGLSDFFGTPTLNMTWWYMTIAYSLIFVIPALAFLVKKTGPAIMLAAVFIPYIFLPDNAAYGEFARYFPVCMAGIVTAYTNLLDKILLNKLPLWLKWLIGIFILAATVVLRQNPFVYEYLYMVIDTLAAFAVVIFGGLLLDTVPIIKNVLEFIGKNSMHIFFVHTFFYLILWRDFVYSFKYPILIFLVLLALSLGYSVILTLIKKAVAGLYKKIRR